MKEPIILAIDTSCDETCAAVSCGRRILSNIVASQINIHAKYGGVVPHLAKRAHQEKIGFVVREALLRATSRSDPAELQGLTLDSIAVTIGPGLAPALEVGIAFAKNLAEKFKKPLIAVNHMEGHLLSSLATPNTPARRLLVGKLRGVSLLDSFPVLGLLVSGGHTQLVLVKSIGNYQLLGQTLDDAGGEALDKLAKMLKLGYPGGPIVEEMAKKSASWRTDAIPLPVPLLHSKDLNFSFSGLKTAALYIVKQHTSEELLRATSEVASLRDSSEVNFVYNMCASFQKAIAAHLTDKLTKAITVYQPKAVLLGGGVFSNLYFRSQIRTAVRSFNLPLLLPYSKKLFTDNAAMIAIPAYYKFLKKDFADPPTGGLDRQPTLNFA